MFFCCVVVVRPVWHAEKLQSSPEDVGCDLSPTVLLIAATAAATAAVTAATKALLLLLLAAIAVRASWCTVYLQGTPTLRLIPDMSSTERKPRCNELIPR